jgi:hypothetical protein
VTASDDAKLITVDVPGTWSDVRGGPFTDYSGNQFYDVAASTDVAAFRQGWAVSGVRVSASSQAVNDYTRDQLLDSGARSVYSQCTRQGQRRPYSDGQRYNGVFEVWVNCGTGSASFVSIAAEPDDGSHIIWTHIKVTDDDLDVIETIIRSFQATMP